MCITQDINLGGQIGTRQFYFNGWSYDPDKISVQSPSSYETAVVFKEADAVITANLKGTQLSNSQNAYTSGSQRKIARVVRQGVATTLHAVYESNGYCWYEISTDKGQTWEIMNDGKPLSFTTDWDEGKCPSIDYRYEQIVIAWQGKAYDNTSRILVATFEPYPFGTTWYVMTHLTVIAPELNYTYENIDANPVLAINTTGWGVIIWKGTFDNGTLCLKYKTGSDFNGSVYSVPGTDINSYNATLYSHKAYGSNMYNVFRLAFQHSNKIYYYKLIKNQSNNIDFNDFKEVSYDNGFAKNYNPCITALDDNTDNVQISWIAFRKTYPSFENPGGGTQPLGETKVFFRSKNNGVWSAFNSYGSNINSVNINHNSNNTFAFAWSEAVTSNTYVNKFVRSDYLTEFYLSNTSGKNLQVVNYDNLNSMRLNSFTTSTTPYSFSLSNTFYVIPHAIQYYMYGNIVQDTTNFYFRLGDILVGGQQVKFEDLPNDISIPDYETLNSYFVSRPFTLNDNIDFIYSVEYGVTDSLSAAIALQNDKFAHFKVELIDDQSNELLGTFDDITYNSENIMLYEKIAY